jgi:aldehyde dehydrogenase (NAD+)
MSGDGRSSGVEALHEYTQVKSVWVETAAEPAAAFGYAPGGGARTARTKQSGPIIPPT